MAEEKRDYESLTHGACVNLMKDLGDEIRRVASKEQVLPEDDAYLAELTTDFDAVEAQRKRLEREALINRVDVTTGKPTISQKGHTPRDLDDDPFGEPRSINTPGVFANPWNEDEIRVYGRLDSEIGDEYRARALSAIEKTPGANQRRREAMTKILESVQGDEQGKMARQILRTSSPEYLRAFVKTWQRVPLTAAEERAMSLTDSAGGYLVPFVLDPAVVITSDGSFNPMRQFARQVTIASDKWNGVSSAAVAFSWDAEGAEVSDDATTFAQPSIDVHKAQGFVPISFEAFQDAANVTQEVGRLLAFGKDEIESKAFIDGNGSGQPKGIIQALAIDSGTSVVTPTTTNVFGLPDVYKLDEQLPARYRARASWLAHRVIYNDVRQFDTAGGAALWERLGANVPANLLGRPAYEAEQMDSTYGSGENYCLVFGDFDNYVIVDRIGTQVEFVSHLFHTSNNRPSGQRGWLAWYRIGADSINDAAFRVLNIT